MGTYAWVAAASVVILGLVLWLGGEDPEPLTRVSLAAGWEGAVLEHARGTWELRPGLSHELPAGLYRLTLFAVDGRAVRTSVTLEGEAQVLGAPDD